MERARLKPTTTKISKHQEAPAAASQNTPVLPLAQQILHLQRTVGNRAVGRLIQAKLAVSHPEDPYEREADRVAEQVTSMPSPASTPTVQRQMMPEEDKDRDLTLNSPGDRFEQEADRAADHVLTNRETALSRNGRVPRSLSVASPCIQRKLKFDKTTPSEDVNPAQQIAENKIPEPELYLGQTNFLLNGKSFTNASDQTMIDALHKPQIGQTSTTIPSGREQKPTPAVECWFASEPDNQGSYEMKLLKQGSWTHVTEKKNVGGRFPSLKKCKEGFGDVTFVVKGDPNDNDLRDRVKVHENKHATDDEDVFNDVLGTWDKKVTKAYNDKVKTKAPNLTTCKRILYLSHGKSPDDVVPDMAKKIKKKADDFHNTKEGAKPNTQIDKVESDCTVVRVRTG